MKKPTTLIALALLTVLMVSGGLGGCIMDNVTGSGNLRAESFDFSDFTTVEVHSGFRAEITRADSFSIETTADDNLYEYIEVEQSGETLIVRLLGNRIYYSANLNVTITMPEIYKIALSGGSQASINGFGSVHEFEAEMSGGSQLSGAVIFGDVELELSGGSKVNLKGAGDDLSIDASGGSLLNMDEFLADDVSADLSGGSRATVYVSGTLDANLSGGSKVLYAGTPAMGDIDLSGGSEVERK